MRSLGRNRMCGIRPLVFLAFIPVNTTAYADGSFKIQANVDGRSFSGAEVCFFKGREGDAFYDRFLAGGEVRCYPADNTLRIPSGTWNYYVQAAPGFISSHPLAMYVPENFSAPIPTMRVTLLPAGMLDLSAMQPSLGRNEYFAIYVTNESQDQSLPAIGAVPAGSNPVLVPAGMRTLLLIVRDEQIVWVAGPFTVDAGAKVMIPAMRRPGMDVLVVVMLHSELTPVERKLVSGAKPPQVRLVHGETNVEPSLMLRDAPLFDTSLLIFKDVPPGEYVATLSGKYWSPDRLSINVPAERHVIPIAQRPLITRPRASISVSWALSAELANVTLERTCHGTTPKLMTELTLTRCTIAFERCAPRDTTVERQVKVQGERGTEAFDGLEAGEYYVELRRGSALRRTKVPAYPAQTARADVYLDPALVTGKITRHSQPVGATVTFGSGQAVTDADTGLYYAFVTEPPGQRPIRVVPCDSGRPYIELPARALALNDQYDINIPDNRLVVNVADAANGEPIVHGRVSDVLQTVGNAVAPRSLGETNAAGVATDESLPANARFEVCAVAQGYDGACVRDVEVGVGQKEVRIELHRSTKRLVHIASEIGLAPGHVYVVLDGKVIDQSDIDNSNNFRLEQNTPLHAMFYIAGAKSPLMRLLAPNLDTDKPVLSLPSSAGLGFAVTLPRDSQSKGGPIGLELGGIVVPQQVFGYHQNIRGNLKTAIERGQTIEIAPVDSSQPIIVLLWRWFQEIPPNLRFSDPFANPAALQIMDRAVVTGPNVVVAPPLPQKPNG